MKYVLAALCGGVALFMGGCAVLALSAGPVVLIPAGLAFLNVAILGALFGWKVQWKPAFYILAVVDILAAIAAVFSTTSMAANDQPFFWGAAAVFAVKGVLSFVYARQVGLKE